MSPKTRLTLGIIALLYGIFITSYNSEWFTIPPYSTQMEWILPAVVMAAMAAMSIQAWIVIRRGKAAGQMDWQSLFGIMLGVGIVRLTRTTPLAVDYVVGGVLVASALGGLLYVYLRSKKKDTKSE